MANENFFENYFKDNEVAITLRPETIEKRFENINELINFVDSEYKQWIKLNNANYLRNIFDLFNRAKGLLNTATTDSYNYEGTFKNAIVALTDNKIIFSQTTLGQELLNAATENIKVADGIYDYKVREEIYQSYLSNKYYIKGVIQAYIEDDFKQITGSNTKGWEEILQNLHQEYENKIKETYSDFKIKTEDSESELNQFKDDTINLQNDLKNKVEGFLKKNDEEYSRLDSNMHELEKLYKEKLRLSAATEYWEKLSQEYKGKGKMWTTISGIASVIFIIFLSFVLYNMPTILSDSKGKVTLGNVRGTLIFALIASIGVYLIHLFIKLVLSSYHLSRDAREREQLTYVYLALINEKAITEQDRNIVLQALFSRADTGLLKGDSSPTLPDGTISQILKNIKG